MRQWYYYDEQAVILCSSRFAIICSGMHAGAGDRVAFVSRHTQRNTPLHNRSWPRPFCAVGPVGE